VTLIDWSGWAWVLGLLGLGAGVLLTLRPDRSASPAGADPVMPFVRRVYPLLAVAVAVGILALSLAVRMKTGAAFAAGAGCAMVAHLVALRAGARRDAAAAGVSVAAVALLGAGLLYFFGIHRAGVTQQVRFEEFVDIAAGFVVGACVVSLFARHATGGAPGVMAARVADLFESTAAAVIAAVAIGATDGALQGYDNRVAAVALPVLALAAGLVATAAGVAAQRWLGTRAAALAAAVLFLVAMFGVATRLGFDMQDPETGAGYRYDAPFWALCAGCVLGYAAPRFGGMIALARVRRRTANGAVEAAASRDADRIGIGLAAAVWPMAALAVAVGVAYAFAGPYGVALAAVGMLGTGALAGLAAGVDPAAPSVAAGAGTAVGSAGRSFAPLAGGVAALALAAAFASTARLSGALDLFSWHLLVGVLIGGIVPVAVAALAVLAAGRASLPELLVPGLVVAAAAVTGGALLGLEALAGMLAGATLVGVPLALFLSHTIEPDAPALGVTGAVKLMNALALVLVPCFLQLPVNADHVPSPPAVENEALLPGGSGASILV